MNLQSSQGFPPRGGFGPGRGGFDGPPGPPGFRPNFRGGFNRGGFGPGGPGILFTHRMSETILFYIITIWTVPIKY